MAGKELAGFANADESIFENANYLLTPTNYNKRDIGVHRKLNCCNRLQNLF